MDKQTKKLLQNLSDSDPKVRYQAVLALGKMGDTSLIDELDKVATLDQNTKVRDLAYKAVRTLATLKQREQMVAREKLIKAADDDYEWQMISGDISKQAGPVVTEIIWDEDGGSNLFNDPPEAVAAAEGKAEKKRRRKQAKEKQEKPTRVRYRMSGCFKVFLWMAVCVGLLGAAVVAFQQLNEIEDAPVNRGDALYKLNEWAGDNASASIRYQGLLAGSTTIDCAAFDDNSFYKLPEHPEWAGVDQPYHQDNLESFFALMDSVETSLSEARAQIELNCEGKDQLVNTEWPSGDALALVNNANAASQQAIGILDAEWQAIRPQFPTE